MPIEQGAKGMEQEMRKFKQKKLHSGSVRGPVVKSRKQAIAIAMKESGQSKYGKSDKNFKRGV